MADFYSKIKTDERYKSLIIYAYDQYKSQISDPYISKYSYCDALRWVESWLENNKRINGEDYTCERMVMYLNECINDSRFIQYIKSQMWQ